VTGIAQDGMAMEAAGMLRKFWLGAFFATLSSGTAVQAIEFDFASYLHASKASVPAEPSIVLASCTEPGCDPCQACDRSGIDACSLGRGCDADGCDSLFGSESGLLGFGIIKKSETCYDDFISPMTNPVYFEDPRQLTEARGIFLNHKLPVFNQVPGGLPGGRIQVYAIQLRARITENLSVIAVKDGFIVSQSDVVDDGWADLSAGLKYSLYRDAAKGRMLSVGGRYEAPTGQARALQGNGDGVFDFFLSGGARIGNSAHWLTGSGFIFPSDSNQENQMWYWSNHLDTRLGASRFYAFTELNWYNFLKSGNAFPLPIEGGDLFNLGSVDIAGNNIVTNAFGLKFKPNRNLETGAAWEFPLTERRGVLDNRLSIDLILRY